MRLKIRNCLFAKTATLLNIIVLIYLLPLLTKAQQEPVSDAEKSCKTVVVGYVGGISSPNDPNQGIVQIGERLRKLNRPDLHVKVYSHWSWRKAYKWIYESIDKSRDNRLSEEEISSAPKIIIYGHSLGGWTLIKLSRKLEKIGIPVELTVQIDSVGIGDEVIPKNVKTAVNYYQRKTLILRGEKKIRAKDESKTKIVGNNIKDVGHKSLPGLREISDFITERVQSLCLPSATTFNAP